MKKSGDDWLYQFASWVGLLTLIGMIALAIYDITLIKF